MAKKLYITTAIPYVNASPHIGNALDYLLADIWARYQRQNGRDVRFQVGTDEHGTKIAMKAAEAGLTPQEYVDKMYEPFKWLLDKVNATYTDFIRTTDDHHVQAVQYIWRQLAPYIYKDHYTGWYCVGCESFVSDKEAAANNGICPIHNQPYQRLSEENYFFKASAFTDKIREAIVSKRMQIVPETRQHEFLELIKNGLSDVSFSRSRKNLGWGIPVPGDDEQVMYVWPDALSNYITVLGYPDRPEWRDYWPADIQVIGKDILRFHAGIWPAILLALDLPLPKKLMVHGFINVGGSKMSKSLGNVVDPIEIIDRYGVDAFRYYFARHIPTLNDGDFTWEKFISVYESELGNDLGNLVQRVASMILRYQQGVIGDVGISEHDMQPYREAMESLNFDRALDEVWLTVRSLNQYLDSVKPWAVAKQIGHDNEAEAHLGEILAYSAATLLQVSDLLVPFMPDTAAKIRHTFESGVVPADTSVLFPRLESHDHDDQVG